ncbi:MAG: M48 family metallopeptidase [Ktedonobacteraceae bacterium]
MTSTDNPSITQRIVLSEIAPSAIQHPLDRLATEQLKKLRGFDMLMAKYLEFGFERINRVLNNASNVRVGPQQIPALYNMLREGCAILDMPEPELYVSQRSDVNAFTFGHTKPYIVVYAGLLEMMKDDEVMAVIAHELGHVKCGHVLYTMMVSQIDVLIGGIGHFIPAIGQLIGLGMQLAIETALVNWLRRAELTGDRASLLVMQDPKPCISMLAKLAGGTSKITYQLNPEEFLTQARQYKEEGDSGVVNRFYQFLANASKGTHPFAVERAHYLNEWIDSTEYDQILAGNYLRMPRTIHKGPPVVSQASKGQGKYCRGCGNTLDTTDKFCPSCGKSA